MCTPHVNEHDNGVHVLTVPTGNAIHQSHRLSAFSFQDLSVGNTTMALLIMALFKTDIFSYVWLAGVFVSWQKFPLDSVAEN